MDYKEAYMITRAEVLRHTPSYTKATVRENDEFWSFTFGYPKPVIANPICIKVNKHTGDMCRLLCPSQEWFETFDWKIRRVPRLSKADDEIVQQYMKIARDFPVCYDRKRNHID